MVEEFYLLINQYAGFPVLFFIFLILSNIFMVYAWYGHLKNKQKPLFSAILGSWILAGFVYLFHVPANRFSFDTYSLIELKALQEVVAISVFIVFSFFALKEKLRLAHFLGLGCISIGCFLLFQS